MNKWDNPEYVKKQIDKRAIQFNKLCKKQGMQSVHTENGVKTITFQNGQVMKISGPIAETWPVTEYEHKKKGLLF